MNLGTIPVSDISFSVSDSIVGAYTISNKATFKFTPKTKLEAKGGKIGITSPVWFGAAKRD
jgi:hypothetical protein